MNKRISVIVLVVYSPVVAALDNYNADAWITISSGYSEDQVNRNCDVASQNGSYSAYAVSSHVNSNGSPVYVCRCTNDLDNACNDGYEFSQNSNNCEETPDHTPESCYDFGGQNSVWSEQNGCVQDQAPTNGNDCPEGYTCFGHENFEPVGPPVYEDYPLYEPPTNDGCPSGYVSGQVNGNDVCVHSPTTDTGPNQNQNYDNYPSPQNDGTHQQEPQVVREETTTTQRQTQNAKR